MPETQWMTLSETADLMKRMPEQVTRMCEDGKLEYYLEDGRYFVSRESIDLFMHPPIGQAAPANPDSNGTPRRQYGRAPHESEPSPESAFDTQAMNDPDEVNAAGGSVPEDSMEETPGGDDEVAESAEDTQPAEGLAAEDAQPADDLTVTDHEETADETTPSDEVLPGENAGPEPSIQDGEHTEGLAAEDEQRAEAAEDLDEHAEAAEDPGELDVRAVEILADLRAALSRHAMEHKAFCDEIAALADALESTLSHDDDKTSELTREISSLLARYTRR